ncbi:hypothetical protein OK142_22535 [Agrobacterium sp. BT-220-3]|nr:hypothetical protein [Agrobacterium sp. BT-220-3]
MFNLIAFSALRRICIYLPDTHTVKLLERAVVAEGLSSESTTSLAEFEDMIRHRHYTAIVTVSSCIPEIRKLSELPIIDIQSLLDDWRQKSTTLKPSAFEAMTFLQGSCFIAVRR